LSTTVPLHILLLFVLIADSMSTATPSDSHTRKRVQQAVTTSNGSPLNGNAAAPAIEKAEADETDEKRTSQGKPTKSGAQLSKRDRNAIILLVILCE
jgi:hypothetical protein